MRQVDAERVLDAERDPSVEGEDGGLDEVEADGDLAPVLGARALAAERDARRLQEVADVADAGLVPSGDSQGRLALWDVGG